MKFDDQSQRERFLQCLYDEIPKDQLDEFKKHVSLKGIQPEEFIKKCLNEFLKLREAEPKQEDESLNPEERDAMIKSIFVRVLRKINEAAIERFLPTLEPEEYAAIKKAAAKCGVTMVEYILQSRAEEKADEIYMKKEGIVLRTKKQIRDRFWEVQDRLKARLKRNA